MSRGPERLRRNLRAPVLFTVSVLLTTTVLARPDLLPIPDPPLDGMERAVVSQLSEGLAELRALVADPANEDADLADAYGGMGQIFLAYDLTDAGEACLENARRLVPTDFRWSYLLGSLYQSDRRLDEALACFEAALEQSPGDTATLIRLGRVHLARGEPELARPYFEEARGGPTVAAAEAGLAKAAADLGDPAAAARHFEAALAAQPRASSLRYPLAMAYREMGQIDEARQHLRDRGEAEVVFPDPLTQGLLRLAAGSSVHLMFGNRAMRRGNVEAALERFRRAIEADPRSARAHEAMGAALARQGDHEGAVRHYSAALAANPGEARLHYNLGTALLDRGDDGQAVRHFQAALKLVPDYHNARFNLATLLAKMGRFKEARGHYRQLLGSESRNRGDRVPSPDSPRGDRATRYYLAEAEFRLGNRDAAEALLAGLVDDDPSRVPPRLRLAAVLRARGDTETATEHYTAVLELEADTVERAEAHQGLAHVLASGKRYNEAVAHYAQVLEIEPANEAARFGQALSLMLLERYPEARQRLEESRAALPGSTRLTHALARLLAACPDDVVRDGARARELALGLFRAGPNPIYAETVAMAFAEEGRFDEALTWQRRLLQEAERAGGKTLLPRLRERLALYEEGEKVRAPWLTETSNP